MIAVLCRKISLKPSLESHKRRLLMHRLKPTPKKPFKSLFLISLFVLFKEHANALNSTWGVTLINNVSTHYLHPLKCINVVLDGNENLCWKEELIAAVVLLRRGYKEEWWMCCSHTSHIHFNHNRKAVSCVCEIFFSFTTRIVIQSLTVSKKLTSKKLSQNGWRSKGKFCNL